MFLSNGLLLQFISEPLDVFFTLMGDGACIAPRAFSKHTSAQIDQCHAFLRPLVAVGRTDAGADGEVG